MSSRANGRGGGENASVWSSENPADVREASQWFAEHVTLFGEPYTLDDDQVRAAIDLHQNTLVTARAGSGKTRVIVAKIAYLVAKCGYELDEIAAFMFNRTAAAEVNARIGAVKVDDLSLASISSGHTAVQQERPSEETLASRENREANAVGVASTFHKFALDIVKAAGARPQIISEDEHAALLYSALKSALDARHYRANAKEFRELLSIAQGFAARAGQQFPGREGLKPLGDAVRNYCAKHRADPAYARKIFWHEIALATYQNYLAALKPPKTDFNLLMSHATGLLVAKAALRDELTLSGGSVGELRRSRAKKMLAFSSEATPAESAVGAPSLDEPRSPMRSGVQLCHLKYVLIDEYQDFSLLFYRLIEALRALAKDAKLFCVGDDWQAINRFAGSDVNYFINFAEYFPDDSIGIPLATNYRSAQKIVARANDFMLKNYNPAALPAKAFSRERGKIDIINPNRQKFNAGDLLEDALGDGRFLKALAEAANIPAAKVPPAVVKLLKQLTHLLKRHRHAEIMLLHRHNLTSFASISLIALVEALKIVVVNDAIMSAENFDRQIRTLTMHRSKGLESEIVILLEVNREIVQNAHPHATIFELFGDTRAAEIADQQRLLYVALTRAKKHLYILSSDEKPLI